MTCHARSVPLGSPLIAPFRELLFCGYTCLNIGYKPAGIGYKCIEISYKRVWIGHNARNIGYKNLQVVAAGASIPNVFSSSLQFLSCELVEILFPANFLPAIYG